MNEVADHLNQDYLVERLEMIIGRGGYAGHYPHLSFGAGQRFSSKSGYLVRFTDTQSTRIASVVVALGGGAVTVARPRGGSASPTTSALPARTSSGCTSAPAAACASRKPRGWWTRSKPRSQSEFEHRLPRFTAGTPTSPTGRARRA